MKTNSKTRDMTEGTIWKHLILFSIPLLIGNLFQQLYNLVDSIVVGNFVGSEALAAVGTSTPIINMLVGFFMGVATGAGVVISNYFGAKEQKNLEESIHTTLLLTMILGVVFTVIGIAIAPAMLHLMATPEDVFGDACTYLRIFFGGIWALMIYNMGSGILRAVGDSKRPLYFLCLTSITNIILDLLLVIVFDLGVLGVALATVSSEIISAVLVLAVLINTNEVYRVSVDKLCLNRKILRKICTIGLPAGLQNAVISFSNVFVQSYINQFGSACMAGWASYFKVDQFMLLPLQTISMTCTTFIGQNKGAGKPDRMNSGMRWSLGIALTVSVSLTFLVNLAAIPLIRLFTSDPEVIHYGRIFLHFISPFYFSACFNQIHAGVLRGAGDATGPMFIMLFSFVAFRQIYLFTASHITDSFYPIAFAYPAGWIVCTLIMAVYFRFKWRTILEASSKTPL